MKALICDPFSQSALHAFLNHAQSRESRISRRARHKAARAARLPRSSAHACRQAEYRPARRRMRDAEELLTLAPPGF